MPLDFDIALTWKYQPDDGYTGRLDRDCSGYIQRPVRPAPDNYLPESVFSARSDAGTANCQSVSFDAQSCSYQSMPVKGHRDLSLSGAHTTSAPTSQDLMYRPGILGDS